MNLDLFKTKQRKEGIYRQMRGFIAPKHRSPNGGVSQYQILCESGQNVLIDPENEVNPLICRSCYQRVIIGGFYSKYTNTIKPLYVFKTAKPIDNDDFFSNDCQTGLHILPEAETSGLKTAI